MGSDYKWAWHFILGWWRCSKIVKVAQLCPFTKNWTNFKKEISCQEIQEPYTDICWLLSHTTVSSLPKMLPFLTAPDSALAISAAWPPAPELGACSVLSAAHTYSKEHKACDAVLWLHYGCNFFLKIDFRETQSEREQLGEGRRGQISSRFPAACRVPLGPWL